MNRVKDEGVSIAQIAKECGVSVSTLYHWISSTDEGSSLLELRRLRREKRELLMIIGGLTLQKYKSEKGTDEKVVDGGKTDA